MKRVFFLSTALLLSFGLLRAESTSYIVLQKGTTNSLLRISPDGSAMTTIAEGFEGVGLAIDAGGNYIVGAKTRLLSVNRLGVVSTIANAPGDAVWAAIAVDATGNFVIADGRRPDVWRVSHDGSSIIKVATYEGSADSNERPVGIVVDSEGNYRLAVSDLDPRDRLRTARVYRITPAGTVSEVRLRGDRSRRFAGGTALDSQGNLLITDFLASAIFRVASDGEVTKFAALSGQCLGGIFGLARDPETGNLVAAAEYCHALDRAGPDGSGGATVAQSGKLFLPVAVAVESDK